MSIFPNDKLPIDPAAQAYYIRAAQIRAEARAAHEAKSRKLMAQEIAKAIQAAQSGDGSTQATPKRKDNERKRYPADTEALHLLSEAARRKGRKSYKGDSNGAIIKRMIEEPQSKWAARILYGKLKGKANGQGREHTTPIDKEEAVRNWGKYLSAYLKDHPPKQGA